MAETALIAKLVACGLSPSGISVRYEDELQSDVVTISPAASVSAAHFECIHEAARGSLVEFGDQAIGSRYDEFAEHAAGIWMRGEAIKWLKAHGKYEGAPLLKAGMEPKVWAHAAERFCGLREGEAIEFRRPEFMTLKRSFLSFPVNPKVNCLMSLIWLSDFAASGVSFGFVGNAAFAKDDQ